MDRSEIFTVLNRHIFEQEKPYLIKNIAENPHRFVGVFRSTTPRLKLIQNLLQSREIRFGDALEVIIGRFLEDMGYLNLQSNISLPNGKKMLLDQHFSTADRDRFFLIEQKVRDDHDSSKKTGQIDNFREKLTFLKTIYGSRLEGIMYFIDPALTKNLSYYRGQIEALRIELGIPIHLFYNGELFEYLHQSTEYWDVLRDSLLAWRDGVPTEINLNCDDDVSFEQLKQTDLIVWHRLISNEQLWQSGVIQCVFPTGRTLTSLSRYLTSKSDFSYSINRSRKSSHNLAQDIRVYVTNHYGVEFD